MRVNPFASRICIAFSEEGDGSLTFEDFLDLLSVFSHKASREIKANYAFQIYGKFIGRIHISLSGVTDLLLDFDGDGYLDKQDLILTIRRLAGLTKQQGKDKSSNLLEPPHVELLADKVMQEGDLDGDHKLSEIEFESIVSNIPDFVNTFRLGF